MPKQPTPNAAPTSSTDTDKEKKLPTATDTPEAKAPTSPSPKADEATKGTDTPKADEAKAESKPKVNTDELIKTYVSRFEAFVKGSDEISPEALPSGLLDSFKVLPPATKNRASVDAMRAAIRAGADPTRIADTEEALSRAAKAASAKATPAAADPNEAGADRIAAALLTLVAVGSNLPTEADKAVSLSRALDMVGADEATGGAILTALTALGALPTKADPTPDEQRVLASAGRAVSALARAGKGGTGQRQSIDRSLANVADGPLTLEHKGTTYKATLKGGAIQVGKESFDNPTAAAKAVLPADTSVNGWVVWKRDGKTLADLHPAG